ncbi:MAG: acyl-CoA thioesterase [Fibrobacter sp.]|jgi:acyl-CoA hydrolase|nr:acyl-CoA thioesterase [Fibrobacter sp.]
MNEKTVRFSETESSDIVHPSDANAYGFVFGGHLVSLMDKTAGIAAMRHTESKVTTVAIDSLDFVHPAKVGTILTIRASVNRAFHTSLEIEVQVTGIYPGEKESQLIANAHMTFVALGEDGKPAAVPAVIPETDAEKRRYEAALQRREAKKALRR